MESLLIFVIILIFVVLTCQASHFVCQKFDKMTSTLELYCEIHKESVRENCSEEMDSIQPLKVIQLKIEGCDHSTVLSVIKIFTNVHELDISYSKYESLDCLDSKLDKLRKLNTSHNRISEFPLELKNMSELTEIDLSHNELISINSKHRLKAATNLKKIHLSHNALQSINNHFFIDLTNLEYIDLRSNNLRHIPIFSNNKNLKTIHLEENSISMFDGCFMTTNRPISWFFSWKYFTSFDGHSFCAGAPFRVIKNSRFEGVIVQSDGQHELHCNDRSFHNIHRFIAGRNTFENVNDILHLLGHFVITSDLSGNKVEQLNSTTFERFTALETLSLSDTTLPDFNFNSLRKQRHLRSLDISHNKLRSLDNMPLLERFNLHDFNVAGNDLQNTPEIFEYLQPTEIESLDLSDNFINTLNPTAFNQYIALKRLNLKNTSLLIQNTNPFRSLKNLSSLDVSQNNLKNVNLTDLSTTLTNLEYFNASNCQIERVIDVLNYLEKASIVDISENDLSDLNHRSFDRMERLIELNLRNANLSTFDFKSLQNHTSLRSLDISKNHLQEIDFEGLPTSLIQLNIEKNLLKKVHNLNRRHFPHLRSLAIADNRLPCEYLEQLQNEWKKIDFVGNPLNQKDGISCHRSIVPLIVILTIVIVMILCIFIVFHKQLMKMAKNVGKRYRNTNKA